VGSGPFLSGGGNAGQTAATGIGTAVSKSDPRRAEGFTRSSSSLPDSAYVGGQEHVVIFVRHYGEALQSGLTPDTYFGAIELEDCGYIVDIYGRRYGQKRPPRYM
jgi:hypothetical protein